MARCNVPAKVFAATAFVCKNTTTRSPSTAVVVKEAGAVNPVRGSRPSKPIRAPNQSASSIRSFVKVKQVSAAPKRPYPKPWNETRVTTRTKPPTLVKKPKGIQAVEGKKVKASIKRTATLARKSVAPKLIDDRKEESKRREIKRLEIKKLEGEILQLAARRPAFEKTRVVLSLSAPAAVRPIIVATRPFVEERNAALDARLRNLELGAYSSKLPALANSLQG